MKTFINFIALILSFGAYSYTNIQCSNNFGESFSFYENSIRNFQDYSFSHSIEDITSFRMSTHSEEDAEKLTSLEYENDISKDQSFNKFESNVEMFNKEESLMQRNFHKGKHISSIEIVHLILKDGQTETADYRKDFRLKIFRKSYLKKENSDKRKSYWNLKFTNINGEEELSIEFEKQFNLNDCKIRYSAKEVTNRW
ncbi:hypothetical protein N9N67_03135 [Bacteriovoracaceae bacterium]|nr:hypothetical protein [Bacteriovoracaceae bacterium]